MNVTNAGHRVCYGYSRNALGQFVENANSPIVRQIFSLYLNGCSLRSIINWLEKNQVTSPSDKELWTPKAIDKLLSNETYINGIITLEQFAQVQMEKERRSNQLKTEDGIMRKPTRYHSQNAAALIVELPSMTAASSGAAQTAWNEVRKYANIRSRSWSPPCGNICRSFLETIRIRTFVSVLTRSW